MTRRIVAFFACSVLSVSMTISAQAEETGGVVEKVDREREVLKLSDGQIYLMPKDLPIEAVQPGMEVHIIHEPLA
ncbi:MULTISPECIES: DUF1344 domain-containing protein [unclassified Aureimonas]|uniref:DUF1344 domain-containing protein n=1 Tax=unclassified Aureimonas TaxID=2615206 RepID=UPI000721F615|nr:MULTISPECIES: DUF1344 domain-containing protein [unclassified Aureimonas]ALN72977.1 hypothetical protein M673_09630 [Aureimonas sp. AU20]